MLQMIRDRAQGLVVGVIVFFICLTFALFGVQQYIDARSEVVVAKVNGEKIALAEFQRAFQQLRQRARAMFGDTFDPDQWSGAQAKLSTLNHVVDEHLLLQVIEDANMRASDVQVADYVRSSPQFQEDGVFSKDLYSRMVRVIGFSELGFEQQVRKDLVLNQLRAGVAATAFATAEELQRLEQLRQQTRDVGFTILGIELFRDGIEPTGEEVEQYFTEHREDYRVEEKISVSYVELSIQTLMADITVDNKNLRAYYDENQANYTVAEQRNVDHILIRISPDASDEEQETARKKALALRDKALGGDSFEDIARENSDDIGSRTDGGETGYFGRGVMAPEFEEAVYSMSEGDISEPIRTKFGLHVIRLKGIRPGGLKEFDEVRDDVTATVKREQAEALFFEQAEQLSELVYEQPDTLEVASDALGLVVKQTELNTRSELAEMFSAKAVDAAFDPEVLIEGLNSNPIDLGNDRVVALRLEQHEPSSVPPLNDVIDAVTRDLINSSARDAVHAHGEAIVERLNSDEGLSAVMESAELVWEDVKLATRSSSKLNRAVSRAAFRTDPPAGGKTSYIGIPIGIGDYAIVGISNVMIPPVEEINISDIAGLRRAISRDRTAASWRDFVDILKSDSDIETFPERL
ncbi:MAG: hypothetical protein E2O35_00505 [Proteobacteria bacterium]|nr:MAG: hypothetical protein E2O35_00505 [Pseudomonadota bacterium]